VLKVHTKGMPLTKDVDLEKIAEETEGFSGADLAGLAREAGMNALREDRNSKEVKPKHFAKALKMVQPTLGEQVKKNYDKFEKEAGSKAYL